MTGTVYLLHFDRPYGPPGAPVGSTARHYIGWAADLEARLAEHAAGRGARLLALIERAARRELAAAQREEPPVTARAGSRVVICANCGKRLHRQRNGAWYHDHNASVSCRPGEGSVRRAEPREVTR